MKNNLFLFIIPVILVFVLVWKLCKSQKRRFLPYKRQKYLLTRSEYDFYRVLQPIAARNNWLICPKVRLADVVYVKGQKEGWNAYFGKIAQKHLDFVICNRALQPLFAIELDDRSHGKADAIRRDMEKNEILAASEFPLVRRKTQKAYDPKETEVYLLKAVAKQKA